MLLLSWSHGNNTWHATRMPAWQTWQKISMQQLLKYKGSDTNKKSHGRRDHGKALLKKGLFDPKMLWTRRKQWQGGLRQVRGNEMEFGKTRESIAPEPMSPLCHCGRALKCLFKGLLVHGTFHNDSNWRLLERRGGFCCFGCCPCCHCPHRVNEEFPEW